MRRTRLPCDDRNGSAVLMVLILAILLLLAALSLWRANETQETQVETNLARIQSEYLAKGGHQLAMLKARLLPQPLLHASHYAVGRNPFYPHSFGYAHLVGNPSRGTAETLTLNMVGGGASGPAFYMNPNDLTNTPPLRDANFDGIDDTALVEMHLDRFRADLADDSAGGQARIQLSSSTADPILGTADPYGGTFTVSDMRILGGRANQSYSEDAMLVNVDATVTSMVSGENRTWSSQLRRIYRVNRD